MDPSKLGHLVRIFRSKDRYGFEFGRMDPFVGGSVREVDPFPEECFGREFFGLDQLRADGPLIHTVWTIPEDLSSWID